MFDLTGKSALVTGASGGIGAEIARALHGAGAQVALHGTRTGPLEELAAELGERAFVTPGNTGGPRVETDQARLFWNQLRLLGSTMGTNDEFREVIALFNAGHIAPVIDRVIPFNEAQQAWERLEAGEQFGKIVIDWSDA